MEKQGMYKVTYNSQIAKNIYKMILTGDTEPLKKPGQFVNIKIPGLYLRRPISVCDVGEGEFSIIYKIVGQGTTELSQLCRGETLDILTGLGNGFNINQCGNRTLLIGGGVGIPPLYWLAKALLQEGKTPVAILGFNTAAEIFMEKEFINLDIQTFVTTMDGSYGSKGVVTNLISEKEITGDYFCACGPIPMLRAVCTACSFSGQVSFEQRMGCGFGACMCCSIMTKKGPKRICKEGPVLLKEEILW